MRKFFRAFCECLIVAGTIGFPFIFYSFTDGLGLDDALSKLWNCR